MMASKINTHGLDNSSSNCLRVVARGEAIKNLSEKEQRLHEILSKTSTRSYWGAGIRTVVKRKSITKFRELIQVLKSQAADGPEVMESIVGVEAMKLLSEL